MVLWALHSKVDCGGVTFLRFLLILFLCVGVTEQARADDLGQVLVDMMYEVGETRLELANSVLSSTTEFLSANPDVNRFTGHSATKALLGESRFYRSVLVVDPDGQLLYDSFNRIRFFQPDVSDRSYYRDGWNVPAGQFQMHDSVVGRQSGLPFIPITMKSVSGRREDERMAVLVFEPSALIPEVNLCSLCGMLVIGSGKVVAASHLLSEANQDIAARMSFSGSYGETSMELRGMALSVHWKRSKLIDATYVYYSARGVRDE